jgi:hypothetical protein
MGSSGKNSCSSLVTLTDLDPIPWLPLPSKPLLLPLLLSFPFAFFYNIIFKGTWLSENEHLAIPI